MLIDARAVQAELQRRLSVALGGQVSWHELNVRLLPAPRGELRGLRIELPEKLDASADEVNVYLRLWPLLRGQAEVSSVTIERPRIRVTPSGDAPGEQRPVDAVALYRAVMEPAARALRDFAPSMEFQLNEAVLALRDEFTLRDVRALARTDSKGVELEAASGATFWQRLSVQARVEYADLSARGSAVLEGLAFDKDVPSASLRAQLRTDGSSALECEFDGSVGALVAAVKGKLLLPAGKPPELAAELTDIDVAHALALSRAKGVPVDVIEAAQGKLSLAGRANVSKRFQLDLTIVKSDAAIKVAQLPWKISPRAGQVGVSQTRVTVLGLDGFMETSTFSGVAAEIDLEGKRLASASGRARLELEQWFPWLRKTLPLEEIASLSGQADVVLHRLALRFDRPAEAEFDAVVTPRKVSAAVKALPVPVSVASGTVRAGTKRVLLHDLAGSLGDSPFSKLTAQLELGKTPRVSSASARASVRLDQWFPWLRKKLPLEEVASVSGQADVELKALALRFDRPAEADFDAVVTPRKVNAALKALPVPVSVASGTVRAGAKRVLLHDLAGSLGDSPFSKVAAQIELVKTPRVSSASARASVRLDQWFPWLREKLPLEELASVSGQADIDLKALALRFDRPAEADYHVVVTPRRVSAALKELPDPVAVDGGSVQVGPKQLGFENIAVAMLDARTRVSGSFDVKNSSIEVALAEGTAGEKIVQWALERAEVPPRLEPRTPLRFAARRIAWAPKGALEADARVEFRDGPELALDLTFRDELLELRRVAIKDARSNALLSSKVAGERIEASFSGTLHGGSIAAMLKHPPADSGVAHGELRVTVDRSQPANSIAEGKLQIDALDLTWLAGRKVLIERVGLTAEPDGLRVLDGRFAVEDQQFELQGEGRRTPQGPVIQARLESPGIELERLRPAPDKAPKAEKKPSAIWPLPVTGRIEVRSGFVQAKRQRIEPFAGILSLERQRARLEVKEARTCGLSFPLEFEATPEEMSLAARLSMRNEPLEAAIKCLTGGRIALTGNVDLSADLKTSGRQPNLVRNLTGTVQAEARNGRVNKFALIGNILAFRGLASLEDMEKGEGFPYRRMTAKGHFAAGQFMLEEGFFDSPAARLAASGNIDLLGANSHLSVLIAPLTTVERIVGAIPLLGDVFGGTMVALPVGVNGDIRNPLIVPLGPRAITNQLLGIFERTLKLPGKLMVPPQQPKP